MFQRRRDPRDPERYVVKQAGGCLVLFGLPFVLAGIGVIVAALTGSMRLDSGGPVPLYITLPIGVVAALAGAVLVLFRSEVVFDRRARRITKRWGLVFSLRTRSFPMDEVKAVTVSRDVRTSYSSKSSRTYTVFPVRMAGLAESLTVGEPGEHDEARGVAEEFAKFLGVAVEDRSAGGEVTREAGTLDESLRERRARTGGKLGMPQAPPGCRVTSFVRAPVRGDGQGDEAVFDFPSRGYTAGLVAPVVLIGLLIVVPFAMLARYLLPLGGGAFDAAEQWRTLALLGVVLLVGLAGIAAGVVRMVASATARVRLTASPREITLERRSFLGAKTERLPAGEIEEVELAGESVGIATEDIEMLKELEKLDPTGDLAAGGEGSELPTTVPDRVVARSDRAKIEFGRGLSDEELAWLRDVVKLIVSAPE